MIIRNIHCRKTRRYPKVIFVYQKKLEYLKSLSHSNGMVCYLKRFHFLVYGPNLMKGISQRISPQYRTIYKVVKYSEKDSIEYLSYNRNKKNVLKSYHKEDNIEIKVKA